MTDKEKTIKELKEALDSLDITNKYRLNLIRAIEYLQEEPVSVWHDADKVQKIREGIEILKSQLIKGACASQVAMETRCKEEAYNEVLAILDSLQEEPVSEELEEASRNHADNEEYGDDVYFAIKAAFKAGAKWQAEQFEKNRLKHCNSITNEQAELEQGFIDSHIDKYNRMPTFLDAIEYGMEKMKEQMMAKAIDTEASLTMSVPSICISLPLGINVGDKVKVIVIKED